MRHVITLALLVLALGSPARGQQPTSEQSANIARARQVQAQQAERAARQAEQAAQAVKVQSSQEAARTRRVAAARAAQEPRVPQAAPQQLSPMDVALRRRLAHQRQQAKEWLSQNMQRPGAEITLRHRMQQQRQEAVAMLRRGGTPAAASVPGEQAGVRRRAAAAGVQPGRPVSPPQSSNAGKQRQR